MLRIKLLPPEAFQNSYPYSRGDSLISWLTAYDRLLNARSTGMLIKEQISRAASVVRQSWSYLASHTVSKPAIKCFNNVILIASGKGGDITCFWGQGKTLQLWSYPGKERKSHSFCPLCRISFTMHTPLLTAVPIFIHFLSPLEILFWLLWYRRRP